jgi:NitT/TauT family transport system substrate-binding protein
MLCLIVSCTHSGGQGPKSTSLPAPPIVRLGFSAWPGWFPWQVAQDEKVFANHNLKVDLRWFDGYFQSINNLAINHIDANSQTLSDTLRSLTTGADKVVVLVNDYSTGNDKIIVRQGINSIADLKGKKVAAEGGTVDHFLLLLGMQKAGLRPSDITFVHMDTQKAAEAFVAGKVDAVGVFAPFTTTAFKRPNSKELFSSKDFPGAISDHLVVSRDLIKTRPAQVQAMVDSWFATLDLIKNQPVKTTEIMAKRAGVSIAEYQEYANGTQMFTIADNLKAFKLGNDMTSLPFAAKELSNFLKEVGLIKLQPNIATMFDDRFIKAYAAKLEKAELQTLRNASRL